ncbi:MAG: DoxX family protein [Terriglobia bacterium]
MQPAIEMAPISKAALWTGRIISGLVVLFLLFDGITKVMKASPVLKAAAQLGFSVTQIVGIGVLLLVCTIIYVIPRTSVLGAILLTGYLGGATAIQVHAANPIFETLFPVIFGVLVWVGIYARDERLRALIPARSRSR